MKNDNLKDKIKRNILKLIFCRKKTFDVNGVKFHNAKPTTVKNSMIAENEDSILKLELYKHRHKHNNLKEEAEILEYLKNCGAMCQPIIKTCGKNAQNFDYMIIEKIEEKEGINLSDVLLAILEQHKFGVFHRDTKTDNVLFNGLIAKIIDYDQSQFREETKNVKPQESVMYFIENLAHFWKFKNTLLEIGEGIEEVTKNCLDCFVSEAFDFSKTNLYKSFNGLPFWEVNEKEIYSKGKNNIKDWEIALDEIDFSQNENILEINPDTGALSRYLANKNCRVSIFTKDQNEIYATKIISNIIGEKIEIVENIKDEFDTIVLVNNKDENLEELIKSGKRIILKLDNDSQATQKMLANYSETKNIKLDENSRLVVFERIN